MKAKIMIDKSAALIAGLDNQGEYVIDFDPSDLTLEQRQELAKSGEKDGVYLPYMIGGTYYTHLYTNITTPDIDALRAIIDRRIAERKDQEAKQKEKDLQDIEKYITSKTDEELIDTANYYAEIEFWAREYGVPAAQRLNDQTTLARMARIENELIPAKQAEIDAERAAKKAEAERRRAEEERKEAIKAREKEESAKRLAAQLDAWVAEHGTADMKERHAEGLLARSEIKDAMRDQTFAPLADFPRYRKMKKSEICDAEGYEYEEHDVSFEVETAESLSAEEYAALKAIREAAPDGAVVEPRIHTATCDECDYTENRTGFMVRITIGELEFSREYGMTQDEPEHRFDYLND
jgi:hypothetical protein